MTGNVQKTLIRGVRVVPLEQGAEHIQPMIGALVDLRLVDGRVRELGARLTPHPDDLLLEADGRWAMPGFWDQHVHFGLWAQSLNRLDTSGTSSAAQVLDRLAARIDAETSRDSTIVGFGHRSATWPSPPSVADLDAISGEHPVVLISGDAHNGWCNTRALRLLGGRETGTALAETDWFPLYARLDELPGADEITDAMLHTALTRASALGVVGIVDFDFVSAFTTWPERASRGLNTLRVRAATYAQDLDRALATGLRSGESLVEPASLITMGPLKIISDGSLNTQTAWCHEPYAHDTQNPCGAANLSAAELRELLSRATHGGLEVAVHAIGDAAVGQALDAVEATGARGSIEHAQLISRRDIARMATLPVRASVQPAHLWDDRDVTDRCWRDRADRCFPFASLLNAGVPLALGSDAPVSPLDPWLALAAAVHRSADERAPWHGEQALNPAQALAASVDGQATLAVGSPADLVLLDENPLALGGSEEVAAALLRRPVAATLVAGQLTFSTL